MSHFDLHHGLLGPLEEKRMVSTNAERRDHAIVIGGSMGGLLAARVLSSHYRHVTLIERDVLPQTAENRRGVPQGRHTHGLLASGREVLDRYFPGISQTLIERGAVTGDVAADSRWFFQGACLTRFASGLDGLMMTRPLLEATVRERVLALPNVARRDGTAIEGLTANEAGERVTGVRLRGESLEADLTVDTSGRGSKSPQWLESIGYEKPSEESVEVALGYAARFFRRKRTDLAGDIAAIIPPTPSGKRGGVMLAQEGDRWVVTLISHFGNYAPEDLSGFVEYSRTLPAPFIHDVIRRAEPVGDPVSARFPASIRRRYEKLSRFPGGYLVFGDAISSFNPIYGQGMSAAALEAVELDQALSSQDEAISKRFFTSAAKVVDIPWSIAAGNDLRMPEAKGKRTLGVKIINWYMSKLHRAAQTDPVPALAFHRVSNLLAPPPSVLHPRVALHVLWRKLAPSGTQDALPEAALTSAAAQGGESQPA